jgi:hypothetical protein
MKLMKDYNNFRKLEEVWRRKQKEKFHQRRLPQHKALRF